MAKKDRMRYWKITSEEMNDFNYDETKLLNWEIKCIREPEDEAHFIGVFMYRNGTAYDYESIKGICYFHNNIDRKELPEITKFLQGKYCFFPFTIPIIPQASFGYSLLKCSLISSII